MCELVEAQHLYAAGLTIKEVAGEIGCSPERLYGNLRSRNNSVAKKLSKIKEDPGLVEKNREVMRLCVMDLIPFGRACKMVGIAPPLDFPEWAKPSKLESAWLSNTPKARARRKARRIAGMVRLQTGCSRKAAEAAGVVVRTARKYARTDLEKLIKAAYQRKKRYYTEVLPYWYRTQ